METRHDTVLLHEAVEALSIERGDTLVDATFGAGGHFKVLAERLAGQGTLIGIDADEHSFARAKATTDDVASTGISVHLVNDNFRRLEYILDSLGIDCIDGILFDLGWNAFQLSEGRGFSFKHDEPLHMTYGAPDTMTTASDLVNSLKEEELADVIYTYGEERFSRGIARAIVEARKRARIETTGALAEAVLAGTPSWYHHRKIHPATKTFQALRIATNDELGALREALAASLTRLTRGGRIAVITFHSIEDRIVKSVFKDAAYEGKGTVVTRKPVAPSEGELAQNPRARSAKLRVFERCTELAICTSVSQHVHEYA